MLVVFFCFFFFKQKTAYEMRISDWSSDVCSSDLYVPIRHRPGDAMPAAFSRERRQQNRPASRKFHSVRRVSGQKGTLARLINRKPIFRSLKNAVNIYTAYQPRIQIGRAHV